MAKRNNNDFSTYSVSNKHYEVHTYSPRKSFIVAITDEGDEFYIPHAEHIERNDALMLVEDDIEAAREAERYGIKLIYGMGGVPDGVYLDTPENREIIIEMLEKYPEYRR